MQWPKEIMRAIRDNAAYEIVRLAVLAILLPLGYGVWSLVKKQPLEWGLLLIFIAAGLVILVAALIRLRNKGARLRDSVIRGIGNHEHERKARLRMLVVKVRDLIKSTEDQPLPDRYDVLGGLIKYSDDFKSDEEVRLVCEELEHEFGHPFKRLEEASNNALGGKWLDFLRDARVSRSEIKNLTQAIGWAATRWRNAERWKQGRRQVTGIYPGSEQQPIFAAIDKLKELLQKGERMFGGYRVSQIPTSDEVEEYISETTTCARQDVFTGVLRPRDLARFEKFEVDRELLRSKAELADAGLVDFDSVTFDRLFIRTQRMKELIGTIESR